MIRLYSLWLDLHYEEEKDELNLELTGCGEFFPCLESFEDRKTYDDNGKFSGRRLRGGQCAREEN